MSLLYYFYQYRSGHFEPSWVEEPSAGPYRSPSPQPGFFTEASDKGPGAFGLGTILGQTTRDTPQGTQMTDGPQLYQGAFCKHISFSIIVLLLLRLLQVVASGLLSKKAVVMSSEEVGRCVRTV